MSKATKLYIMFGLTLISSLVVPIFTQWYESQTGVFPYGFCFILFIGGFLSYVGVATNNFKDFE